MPIKKNHHRSRFETQPRPEQTTTTTQPRFETHRSKPIQKKSSPKPPQSQPNHDQRPTSAVDPRPTTHFIPARRSTTNDPLQPPIHDHDPTTPIHNPQPTTTTDPRRHQTHKPRPTTQTADPIEKEEREEMVFGLNREESRE